jgi:lipid-binding SYLF domain-containing protein
MCVTSRRAGLAYAAGETQHPNQTPWEEITMLKSLTAAAAAMLIAAGAAPARADDDATKAKETRNVDEKQELTAANNALQQIVNIKEDGIPEAMLNDAAAIVVVPEVIKVSFIVGARHGDGVMVVRNSDGSWSSPIFVELTGANVGLQAGAQSSDVVLVFKNADAAWKVLDGEFALGADVGVAAGPVGREASAATGAKFDHEIYSYSRSKGVFAGAALDGSKLSVNKQANADYYGAAYADPHAIVSADANNLKAPAEARAFCKTVAATTNGHKSQG